MAPARRIRATTKPKWGVATMTTRRTLTPEDVLGFKSVSDAQVSPDGDLVAFVVGDQFKLDTKLPRSGVWVVDATGGEPRRFTSGPRSDSMPRWSPDGRELAFLSDREEDGQRQIWLLPRAGGEATQLTHVDGTIPSPRSLEPMAWSPDGKRIAFIKVDPETEDEKRHKQDKSDIIEFEQHPKYARLYTVDIDSGEESCVSPDGLQVWEFCWSPTSDEIAAVASDVPFEQAWYSCRLAKFSTSGGAAATLHQAKRQVARPVWSPDGKFIAFQSSNWSDRGSAAGAVFVVPSDGGPTREISKGHVASACALRWSDDSKTLLSIAHERGGMGVAWIDLESGERTPLWHDIVTINEANSTFSQDNHGNIALVRDDATHPKDVWLGRPATDSIEWTRLTNLHPQADDFDIGTTESIHWKGADGWDMQGLLIRPAGANADGRHPMVTVVHGGPTSMHRSQFYASMGWLQLLASAGIAVFMPNPRGSTGWGLEFAESNIGDMGGKDWEDIQAGIDHCIDAGVADPTRLGVAGWSYGGFMTAWAVTQTDRFKAAMMGAGISDWRSFHGKSYLSDWDSIHYGDADPWDPDGLYKKFSPINFVKQVSTPTLILHGEVDEDVPVEQSYMFYRALKDLNVETELVVYPREPHGLSEKAHMLDLGQRVTEWFAKQLEP